VSAIKKSFNVKQVLKNYASKTGSQRQGKVKYPNLNIVLSNPLKATFDKIAIMILIFARARFGL